MLIIVSVMLTTILIRFFPFLVIKGDVPPIVKYLGDTLLYATMAMLVVYCLKEPLHLNPLKYNLNVGIPELVATIVTIISYKIKHNTLLSIILGTVVYMLIVNSSLLFI